ncbi:MAG: AMP-binding protein [Pseudomonadota bacterium]|nr:AMP-binding protein [Pseudomonadota bacterium]
MATSIRQVLNDTASSRPDDIWLVTPETETSFSWKETDHRAETIACYLQGAGISIGASVAIAAPNGAAASFAFLGVVYGGYRATPLNLVAGIKTLAFVLNHSKAEVILCANDSRALVDEAVATLIDTGEQAPRIIPMDVDNGPRWAETGIIPVEPADLKEPSADTIGLLMYTSGTTGVPKGVLLSHANLIAAGINVAVAHELTPADTSMCVLPIYHINGLCVTVMGSVVSSSGLVMPRRFSARHFWVQMHKYKCSWFSAVPTLFSYLLNDDTVPVLDRDRLRFARSASAPLPPEIHRQFEKRFSIPIIETMGLTETGAQILSNPLPPEIRKIGSPGIAYGNEVMVGDEKQNPVATNEEGEILVRGSNVMQGYLYRPEETAKTITANGWLRTGDLGRMDEDGFIFVTGRIKELIIKGGENIAPREIDEALLEHEAVLEAAAFPRACKDYGQRVEACVCLKKGRHVSENELRKFCEGLIGSYKTPENIYFLDDLPKGPSGKVQRMKLIDLTQSVNT